MTKPKTRTVNDEELEYILTDSHFLERGEFTIHPEHIPKGSIGKFKGHWIIPKEAESK